MVHSGYHPLKHRPVKVVFGMAHSGYHPLKHRPLSVVFGWRTVDIILLNIVLVKGTMFKRMISTVHNPNTILRRRCLRG